MVEHIKKAKHKICFDMYVQKVIRALVFRSREKFDISFFAKLLV